MKRFRCAKGHLIRKGRPEGSVCNTCWDSTPKGLKCGRRSDRRRYWKAVASGLCSQVANRVVVPGDEKKTTRRVRMQKVSLKPKLKRYRNRWGRIDYKFKDRFRSEMIRSGQWKEEEHPL